MGGPQKLLIPEYPQGNAAIKKQDDLGQAREFGFPEAL